MKKLSSHISSLLGFLMIAAILLPALHVLNHDLNAEHNVNDTEVVIASFNCDLCDFHFSSPDIPEYTSYDLYLPVKEHVYSISISDTVYPYSHGLFSLRAPPAVIV